MTSSKHSATDTGATNIEMPKKRPATLQSNHQIRHKKSQRLLPDPIQIIDSNTQKESKKGLSSTNQNLPIVHAHALGHPHRLGESRRAVLLEAELGRSGGRRRLFKVGGGGEEAVEVVGAGATAHMRQVMAAAAAVDR